MRNIHMIGNTHFDPVWLWKWDEGMLSIHSTFRSALDRISENNEFIYSFACPPVFEWIKQIDPEMYEEIKIRIKEERWELCEGWWLQPDCFSACGESYARQSLYGQRYLKEHFGKYADTVFNVDSFGHNSAIPQILQKSHISFYCMCRPENHHFQIESPYFQWMSKDGSSVQTFRIGQNSEIYNKDMIEAVNKAEEKIQNATHDEMMVYGVTNHGGAPTKKAISDIFILNKEKAYDVYFSSVTDYFKSQAKPDVTVTGEMLTKDFGPYTNNHLVKKRNRIAEYAMMNAEKAMIIAKHILDIAYKKKEITDCWKDIMFNQFHDILGGASIKDAYTDAYNQQGRAIFTANELMHSALQSMTKKMKMPGENPNIPWNVVVWNLNCVDYDGYIEAEIQWLHEFDAYFKGILLEDEYGEKYPTQILLEKSVIPGFRSRFIFKAKVPSIGYKIFRVVKTEEKVCSIKNNSMKKINTDAYEVTFDKINGVIESIFLKKLGKEFKEILRPECYEDKGDTWCFNISRYGKKLEDFHLLKFEVTEEGCMQTTVKVTYQFRNSFLYLYYVFYDENYIDVKYVVNWNESHIVLKLVSDTGYSDLIVSSPFSTEKRSDYDGDMPMGEWVSMYDKEGGISFIADSLFSYSKKGSIIGFSVLRSCIYGDLRIGEINLDRDYSIMEQGLCEGRIRIVFYSGKPFKNQIQNMAIAFNNMPIVMCEANHNGIFSSSGSYMAVSAQSVAVSAMKECETDTSDILRLYEFAGKKQTVDIHYFDNDFSIPFNPYEIKTINLNDVVQDIEEVFITEDHIIQG